MTPATGRLSIDFCRCSCPEARASDVELAMTKQAGAPLGIQRRVEELNPEVVGVVGLRQAEGRITPIGGIPPPHRRTLACPHRAPPRKHMHRQGFASDRRTQPHWHALCA
jgi:hypothetical protein